MVRLVAISCVVGFIAACGDGDSSYECTPQTNCTQAGVVGYCRESTGSDSHYCAYPDGTCPSGERWGVLAGEGLAEQCVADEPVDAGADAGPIDGAGLDGPVLDASLVDAAVLADAEPADAAFDAAPPPPTRTVTVVLQGSGKAGGRVVSQPAGIDCPGTCTASFLQSMTVTLEASGSFLGWSGPCAADQDKSCAVSGTANASVPASFGISGTAEWLDVLNNSSQFQSAQAQTLPSGDLAIALTYSGEATFRGQALPSTQNGFTQGVLIARLNPLTGEVKWQRVLLGTGSVVGTLLATTSAGDLVLLGHYTGTVDTGAAQHTSMGGTADLLLTKLAGGTGQPLWSKAFGSTEEDAPTGLGVDPSGNVVVSLDCAAEIDFGGGALVPVGGVDSCVAKLSGSNGSNVWSRSSFGSGTDGVGGLAVDGAGDVILTGHYSSSTKLYGSSQLPVASGGVDAVVIKLRSADGAFLFAKTFGGTGEDRGVSVSTDGANNIFTSIATFSDPASFMIVRLSAIGAEAWRKTFSGEAPLVAAGTSEIHLTGGFIGTLTLGTLSVTSAGSVDGFVATLRSSDGLQTSLARFGGLGLDLSSRVVVGPFGQRYVTGKFSGIAEFFGLNATSQATTDGFVLVIAP